MTKVLDSIVDRHCVVHMHHPLYALLRREHLKGSIGAKMRVVDDVRVMGPAPSWTATENVTNPHRCDLSTAPNFKKNNVSLECIDKDACALRVLKLACATREGLISAGANISYSYR